MKDSFGLIDIARPLAKPNAIVSVLTMHAASIVEGSRLRESLLASQKAQFRRGIPRKLVLY